MNYDESLNLVLLKRKHYTLESSVQRRLIASGKNRGISLKHISRVLKREATDEDVVKAALEAIALDKQFDEPKPIGLMTRKDIVNEYKALETNFILKGFSEAA